MKKRDIIANDLDENPGSKPLFVGGSPWELDRSHPPSPILWSSDITHSTLIGMGVYILSPPFPSGFLLMVV